MYPKILTDAWWPVLLVLPVLLMLMMNKRRQMNDRRLPPGPPRLPIIGNLHQVGPLFHQSLAKLAQTYGPVMLLRFGYSPAVIVSTAEAAKEVLQTHDTDFCTKPPMSSAAKFSNNYADIAFTPYNECWREMRKMGVLHLFCQKRVQCYEPVRLREIESLIKSITVSASRTEPVNLSEKLHCLTANITFEVAYDVSFKTSTMDYHEVKELIEEVEDLLTLSAADNFPYVGWIADWLTGKQSRMGHAYKKMDEFFQQVIEEHISRDNTESDREDFIDVMLRVEKEGVASGINWFTKENIKGVMWNIFTGAIGTPADVLTWAMTELAKNPDIMQRAQAEVRHCIGKHGKISGSDVDNLSYLKMVLKETLRLHPPVPCLARESRSQCQILNFKVEPKTRVYINYWAIAHDPKVWSQPGKFVPERFEDNLVDYKGQHVELLPFGAGRRMCPGINFGMSTVELALANLLYWFDWKLPDRMQPEDISVEESAGITAYKKIPLELVPAKHTAITPN